MCLNQDFVRGDGIGPDITKACLRVYGVQKGLQRSTPNPLGGVFMGEKAAKI